MCSAKWFSVFSAIFVLTIVNLARAEQWNEGAVKLKEITTPCAHQSECEERDAIIFVHGIYGNDKTFKNGSFDWPRKLPAIIEGRRIDVYRLDYQTAMVAWSKQSISSFDEVADAFFVALNGRDDPKVGNTRPGLLTSRPYRSIGFIAHSLGGNFSAAYIHTVKSELGHIDRARTSFLITLGTPANGAGIADVVAKLKGRVGMRDPLLNSLKRDNAFVRMLAMWRRAENSKAARFGCRPVNLYVAVEGARVGGITKVVPEKSAVQPYETVVAKPPEPFPYDHFRIAKPSDENDRLYEWVYEIIASEMRRMNEWGKAPLCSQ